MTRVFVFTVMILWGLLAAPSMGLGNHPKGEAGDGPDLMSGFAKNIQTTRHFTGLPGEKIDRRFGDIPLYFIPNRGQVSAKARFYARTPKYTLWLTSEGMVFDGIARIPVSDKSVESPGESGEFKRNISRLVFLHANPGVKMVADGTTSHKLNVIKGKQPEKQLTGIPTFKSVIYKEIYHAVDLKVYGIEKQIEYDWVVNPGGDPGEICFFYKQVNGTQLDGDGNLVVDTGYGELVHRHPVAYQEIGGERIPVDAEFRKINTDIYGIQVGTYDKKHRLVIDPVVTAFSTFLGTGKEENCFGMAVDDNGCAYLTGNTYASDFPVKNAYQSTFGGGYSDMFVTKFSASGDSLVYSTYIGGTDRDAGEGIVIDADGRAYVAGHSRSADFPMVNAYQATHGGDTDAIVLILGSDGNTLEYSTFLGGDQGEKAFAIDIDDSKNIYVVGTTSSYGFPTVNAYDSWYNGGGSDAFVSKIKGSDKSLAYSTFLGGNSIDAAYSIAVQGGNAYITGRTGSSNFPRLNEYQSFYGGGSYDVFVTKMSSAGTSLIYSTFLGGDGNDSAWGIDVDDQGKAYVVGNTVSSDFPTLNGYQTSMAGVQDAFITCLNSFGSSLYYSTYFGGFEADAAAAVKVNSTGHAYVVGSTMSSNFPVKRANASYSGSYDAFVTVFDPAGSSINFSTYLGGSQHDTGKIIALDGSGDIYIAGITESWDFPDVNAYQDKWGGIEDAYLAKLSTSQFGTLCGAVDNCDLVWSTGGDADWFEQTMTAYYDDDALQSGAIGDNQSTYVQATVQGPGALTFRWKVSSSYSDTLTFQIDGVDKDFISGSYSSTWYLGSFSIPDGTHTVKWVYRKNASYSYGSDCGWLDRVTYSRQSGFSLNRDRMTFGNAAGKTTGSQTFSIESSGSGSLDWSVSTDKSWLSCSPSSGSGSGVVTVNVNTSALGVGTYKGVITVAAPSASNSPQTIEVTLTVYGAGASAPPFGSYDTPSAGATIFSSVPFTGWVLDDVEVSHVKLYVDYGNGTMDYVGKAAFVEGARPDVENAFPGYPYSYKAGWGYMMLTNYLPGGGNGTYNIKVIATDMEGNQTVLGTKTLIVDNVNAVKPFGALESPEEGGTASGASFTNWGWVLTPQPNAMPTDGSTIHVMVDGKRIGNPVYNLFRIDIAKYFPNYANTNGAVGYFKLDTTAYENGVHVIQWQATDDAGNTDGIGSRFFTIQNSSSRSHTQFQIQSHTQSRTGIPGLPVKPLLNDIIDHADRFDPEPVLVKRGARGVRPYGLDNGDSGRMTTPGENGDVPVTIEELEHVQITLEQPVSGREIKGYFIGWSVVGKKLRPLPIGSTLDAETGIFYWSPGPGFVGDYPMIFVKSGPEGLSYKRLTVRIEPKF